LIITLVSIDKVIGQLKYASIDNFDVSMSAHSLLVQPKGNDSYRIFEQTYQRQLLTYGADHLETLITRFNMALALYSQERPIDALSMLKPLLKKVSRVLPLDDPLTLATMADMASALCELDRDGEALNMYEDVVPKYAN
jgi:hypothetical protein